MDKGKNSEEEKKKRDETAEGRKGKRKRGLFTHFSISPFLPFSFCLYRLHPGQEVNHRFAEDIILIAGDHVSRAGDISILGVRYHVEELLNSCVADDVAELTTHEQCGHSECTRRCQ